MVSRASKTPLAPVTAALLAFGLTTALVGCGSGGLGLTGGSIPIGAARLSGVVVEAASAAKPLPAATVTLATAGQQGFATAGPDGRFTFADIKGTVYTCTVTPPSGSGAARNWTWTFALTEGQPSQLVAAVWPTDFDPTTVQSVQVTLPATVRIGQTVLVTATATGVGAAPIAVRPSLLMTGAVGDLSGDGAFHATLPGHAAVTAWINGVTTTRQFDVTP